MSMAAPRTEPGAQGLGHRRVKGTDPLSRSHRNSPREGRSDTLAAEGTYSNHVFARTATLAAWNAWTSRAAVRSLTPRIP